MHTKIVLLLFLGLYSVSGKVVKPKPYTIIQQAFSGAGDYKATLKGLHEIKQLISGNGGKRCPQFGNKHIKNVALQKKVIQTSQYNSRHRVEHAVNGNIYDVFATKLEKKSTFRVDLGRIYRIFDVDVYNRKHSSHAAHFREVDIKVGRTMSDLKLCGHYRGPAKSLERVTIRCETVMTGRFVELKLTQHRTHMNFRELMVWGTEI